MERSRGRWGEGDRRRDGEKRLLGRGKDRGGDGEKRFMGRGFDTASPCLYFIAAVIIFSGVVLHAAPGRSFDFDIIIKGGTIYDGSGGPPFEGDAGIKGDHIATVGDLSATSAAKVIDAKGLAVAPGFINMLSWSTASLIIDGRSQSEIHQGVTTEIFGEGQSMGPLTEEMKQRTVAGQGDLKFDIAWTTLSQYLNYLEKLGVSPNVGSFVGAGTVREYVIGLENKKATPAQIERMCELVRLEMEAGALGVGSSLGYAPDMLRYNR